VVSFLILSQSLERTAALQYSSNANRVVTDRTHVRYWHKADIGLRGHNVSCGGKADIAIALQNVR
jgi:hypothetical protein